MTGRDASQLRNVRSLAFCSGDGGMGTGSALSPDVVASGSWSSEDGVGDSGGAGGGDSGGVGGGGGPSDVSESSSSEEELSESCGWLGRNLVSSVLSSGPSGMSIRFSSSKNTFRDTMTFCVCGIQIR